MGLRKENKLLYDGLSRLGEIRREQRDDKTYIDSRDEATGQRFAKESYNDD
jgi:hypothetical protein